MKLRAALLWAFVGAAPSIDGGLIRVGLDGDSYLYGKMIPVLLAAAPT